MPASFKLPPFQLDVTDDGSQLLLYGDGYVVLDTTSGDVIRSQPEPTIEDVVFSPTGHSWPTSIMAAGTGCGRA